MATNLTQKILDIKEKKDDQDLIDKEILRLIFDALIDRYFNYFEKRFHGKLLIKEKWKWKNNLQKMRAKDALNNLEWLFSEHNNEYINYPPNCFQFIQITQKIREQNTLSGTEAYNLFLHNKYHEDFLVNAVVENIGESRLKRMSDKDASFVFHNLYKEYRNYYIRSIPIPKKYEKKSNIKPSLAPSDFVALHLQVKKNANDYQKVKFSGDVTDYFFDCFIEKYGSYDKFPPHIVSFLTSEGGLLGTLKKVAETEKKTLT